MAIDPFQTLVIGTILLFVSSLTFYYWGAKALTIIVPLTGVCIYRFSGDFNSFTLIVPPLIFGSFAGYTIKRSLSVQFYIIGSTVTFTIIATGLYYYMMQVLGIDLFDSLMTQMQLLLEKSELAQNEQTEIISSFKSVLVIVREVVPFYFFLQSVIWSTIAFMILRLFYIFVIIKGIVTIKGLELFKMNDYTVFLLIAFLAGYIFIKPEISETVNYGALNGLLIILLLYLIQALGIIRHFLIRKNLPLLILPLGIFFTLLFSAVLLPVVSILLAGWGLLDVWTDFRNLNKKDTT